MNPRREFLKNSLASIATLSLISNRKIFGMANSNDKSKSARANIKYNTLGKTGFKVYPIAFAGIVVMKVSAEQASMEVENAIRAGVNYFDVAPTYGDAQQMLGPALEPYRKDVYLACKTTKRDAEGAREELEKSLSDLRTDHLDVYQLHAIKDVEKDVKAVFAKGGAMETFIQAKKDGKIRNIGFSAHSPEAALTAMEMYDFDTIMYPISFVTHYTSMFEDEVVKTAKDKNMGIIAIKPMAKQKWPDKELRKQYPKCWYQPIDDPELAKLSFGWTFGAGADIALPPGQNELFNLALKLAPEIPDQLSDMQVEKLKNIAQKIDPIFRA